MSIAFASRSTSLSRRVRISFGPAVVFIESTANRNAPSQFSLRADTWNNRVRSSGERGAPWAVIGNRQGLKLVLDFMPFADPLEHLLQNGALVIAARWPTFLACSHRLVDANLICGDLVQFRFSECFAKRPQIQFVFMERLWADVGRAAGKPEFAGLREKDLSQFRRCYVPGVLTLIRNMVINGGNVDASRYLLEQTIKSAYRRASFFTSWLCSWRRSSSTRLWNPADMAYGQRRLPDLLRNCAGLGGTYPGVDLVRSISRMRPAASQCPPISSPRALVPSRPEWTIWSSLNHSMQTSGGTLMCRHLFSLSLLI